MCLMWMRLPWLIRILMRSDILFLTLSLFVMTEIFFTFFLFFFIKLFEKKKKKSMCGVSVLASDSVWSLLRAEGPIWGQCSSFYDSAVRARIGVRVRVGLVNRS